MPQVLCAKKHGTDMNLKNKHLSKIYSNNSLNIFHVPWKGILGNGMVSASFLSTIGNSIKGGKKTRKQKNKKTKRLIFKMWKWERAC